MTPPATEPRACASPLPAVVVLCAELRDGLPCLGRVWSGTATCWRCGARGGRTATYRLEAGAVSERGAATCPTPASPRRPSLRRSPA